VTTAPSDTPDPDYVVIAGDWHRNLRWALHVIETADELFTRAGETRRIIIQLGDFGFRPVPANPDLIRVNNALARRGMELWFIDGNHEHWPDIQELCTSAGTAAQLPYPVGIPLPNLDRIRYLPRGTRWKWAGRTWLAVGGAASVDRLLRTEGVSWWPDEEITPAQADAIIAAGSADVLLSHDCPDSLVPWDLLGPPAQAWIPELPRARAHAARLERIARAARVLRVFHGHYHVAADRWHDDVHVTSLQMDGMPENFQLVDVGRACGATDE
jgi:hypothetical protein